MDSNIILIANIIGGIGLVFTALSMIFKKKKWVILMQGINSIFQIVSYSMLQAWSGCFLNVVVLIMDIFIFFDKQTKPISIILLILAFSLGMVGVVTTVNNLSEEQIFSIELTMSLLPVLGTTLYNFTTLKKDVPLVAMKAAFLVSCALWAVYSLHIKSYVGVAFNIFAVITSLVAIIDYNIKLHNENKNVGD